MTKSAWPLAYADERLDALLSITGRMDGFLYRCRNDASYTMLYISDGIRTLTGHEPADFIHNRVLDYSSAIHPDDLPGVYSAVDEALATRRNWNIDYRMLPKSGSPVWVREIGGGVFNDGGDLVFLEGFVIDITDRKSVEDLNIKLVEELKVANEELSDQKQKLELAKQESDHSANHDALTHLPNRRAFQEKLREAIEGSIASHHSVGLLFIDLDKFKEVNDSLGHDAGDELLQRVAAQLRAVTRSDDFVARIGGDEFAFILSAAPGLIRERSALVANRILKALCIPVVVPDGVVEVGCTVGVAAYPEDAVDTQHLMVLADELMYAGKRNGRHRIVCARELALDAPSRSQPGLQRKA